ncbi:hypothetical protein N5853_09220 [Bartonella sp. HY329]|uniref:hypothetical protein n=1 Tax=unclassified Bartonella TaxID=2645622 RepID=UPI0021CA77AC|nr:MULTISPECIES: hypothetical protein [unclassified Bartonella]UXM94286.1 hypothetical protein N5853_09220 [Bartonella sp. HY329]UXN08609.1 hypothetical protein N5852_09230 [Bartonella sp. HY328]
MAARIPPITVALLESYLDYLANLMVEHAPDFDECLPIYERLEAEIEILKNREKRLAAVYARAKKLKTKQPKIKESKDQTARQSD